MKAFLELIKTITQQRSVDPQKIESLLSHYVVLDLQEELNAITYPEALQTFIDGLSLIAKFIPHIDIKPQLDLITAKLSSIKAENQLVPQKHQPWDANLQQPFKEALATLGSMLFSILPKDILFQILMSLSIQDLLSLSRVNKHFANVINDPYFWKHYAIEHGFHFPTIPNKDYKQTFLRAYQRWEKHITQYANENNSLAIAILCGDNDKALSHLLKCVDKNQLNHEKMLLDQGNDAARDKLYKLIRQSPYPLHLAAAFDNKALVNNFLTWGVYINTTISYKTPLHFAISMGDVNLEMIKFLLEQKTTFHKELINELAKEASLEGHIDILTFLLEKFYRDRNNLDHDSEVKNCLLLNAIKAFKNRSAIIRLLIRKGAALNNRYYYEPEARPKKACYQSILHLAAKVGYADAVTALIQHGINPNIRNDYNKETPLHITVEEGKCEAAQALIHLGANVNISNRYDQTPLDIAVYNKNIPLIKILIAAGALLSFKIPEITVLHMVLTRKPFEPAILNALLAHPDKKHIIESLQISDGRKNTPLSLAIEDDRQAIIRYFEEQLSENISSKQTSRLNQTLDSAIRYNKLKFAQYLLLALHRHKIKINSEQLLLAAQEGHLDLVRILIEIVGISPDTCDSQGQTPLHVTNHLAIIHYLIKQCHVNVNNRDYHGKTPLLTATKLNHKFPVCYLLEVKADPTISDWKSNTPLSYAKSHRPFTESPEWPGSLCLLLEDHCISAIAIRWLKRLALLLWAFLAISITTIGIGLIAIPAFIPLNPIAVIGIGSCLLIAGLAMVGYMGYLGYEILLYYIDYTFYYENPEDLKAYYENMKKDLPASFEPLNITYPNNCSQQALPTGVITDNYEGLTQDKITSPLLSIELNNSHKQRPRL